MKFFPVALVQKSVPEIRGIFVVGSNLNNALSQVKVGSYEDFFPVSLVLGVKYPMHHNF